MVAFSFFFVKSRRGTFFCYTFVLNTLHVLFNSSIINQLNMASIRSITSTSSAESTPKKIYLPKLLVALPESLTLAIKVEVGICMPSEKNAFNISGYNIDGERCQISCWDSNRGPLINFLK